jgi:type II secretory pathway pseudopilin PulG
MCATTASRVLRDERGVGVVAVLLVILILALLGTVMVALTVQEMDAARLHANSEQALSVAAAGLDWAEKKYGADPTWTGLAAPGKPVGRGNFHVTIATTDAEGNPLPSGTRALQVTGSVNGARRIISRLAAQTGGVAMVGATGTGNAYAIASGKLFSSPGNVTDATAPNGTYGTGDWAGPDQALWTTFGGATIPNSPITKVEVLIHGYLSQALSNDYGNVRIYYGNARKGPARSLSRAVLNTHVGAANAGTWTVDVTANRAWVAADFAGDLEVNWRCVRKTGNDGALLHVDSVQLRVTTSGSGAVVLGAFQEVIS